MQKARWLLVVGLLALAAAAPARADYWGQSDFRVTWPSSGRAISYQLLVPSTRSGNFVVAVAVDGRWLTYPGVWYSLTCPTFAVRSSRAAWVVRFLPTDNALVMVTLQQGGIAWACFSGYGGGSVSDVTVRTWRR